jgi:Putative Flp pilus-assembly TadE/G-like
MQLRHRITEIERMSETSPGRVRSVSSGADPRDSTMNAPSVPPHRSLLMARYFFPRFLSGVHSDQRGAISVLSVFAIFLFTILLVLIVNVGRQIDDKLRMQNAADAAAYSGATVIARGMNAIAFSNHMLCETFALVAYMREGRDRKSEKFIPEILDAWTNVGNAFANGTGMQSMSQKFMLMGQAIVKKVPVERRMVQEFGEMTFHESRITLPLFEYILAGPDFENSEGIPDRSPLGGFIPRFQRAVLQTIPYIASVATDEIATRYGAKVITQHPNQLGQPQNLRGLLWSTSVAVVGSQNELNALTRTLPVLDPSRTGHDVSQIGDVPAAGCPTCYSCMECISRKKREQRARQYLELWIRQWMSPYFEYPDNGTPSYGASSAKMSNFINFWRVFACANLTQLLNNEYPLTNLPFVLRDPPAFPDGCVAITDPTDPNYPGGPCPPPQPLTQQTLEKNYNFVAAVYWPTQKPMFPGLFQNPLARDSKTYAMTFAQASILIPRGRFSRLNPQENSPWVHLYPCPPNGMCCANLYDRSPGSWDRYTLSNTNPQILLACPEDPNARQPYNCSVPYYAYQARWERFGQWDSFNQNWTVKLVPATAANLTTIISQHPAGHLGGALQSYQAPSLQNIPLQQFHLVNTH